MSTKNNIDYENEEYFVNNLENEYMNPNNKISKHKKEIRLIGIDYVKAKKHHKIEIKGIPVYFPYKPYECQIVYMSKVIESLNNGFIAALESPTGTGKTLCLLCATLAWVSKKRKELNENNFEEKKPPKIYYTSRTHTQLSNTINELKKTVYLARNCILSSREKMCVNSVVKVFKGNLLNLKCKESRMKGLCKYFKGVEKMSYGAYDSCDIEDLYKLGCKGNFCPFHFERNKIDSSDIIFLPYNYIFDPIIRKSLKLNFDNSILIVDEAHNIQDICENGVSCSINSKELDEIIENLKELHLYILTNNHKILKDSELSSIELKSVQDLEKSITNIKNYLKTLNVKQGKFWPEIGLKLNVKELFDIFFEGSKGKNKVQKTLIEDDNINEFEGITMSNIKNKIDLLNKIDNIFNEELQKGTIIHNLVSVLILVQTLSENYLNFQKSEDKNPINNMSNNYKFFIEDVEEKNNYINNKNKKNIANFTNKKIRTLNLFCFNPGFGFSQVINQNILSTIITSGTLAPIESLESELKVEFKIKLENTHVIDMEQVKFSVITNSPNNQHLLYKFDNKNKTNQIMIKDLGITILNLIKNIPGGILVFFTSYSFMSTCINIWSNHELISKFNEYKEIFQDLHNPSQNKLIIENYKKSCSEGNKGGIFFSVCRGSSSEGINFNDDLARMVIVVGIPYANLMDVKVQLKKEYLDEYNRNIFNYLKNTKIKRLTSNDWYTQSATKTVNQALGRVIRHINDYGCMMLIDFRYRELVNKGLISKWIKGACKFYVNNEVFKDTEKFFAKMKTFNFKKNYINKKLSIIKDYETESLNKMKKEKTVNKIKKEEIRSFNRDDENFNIFNDINIHKMLKEDSNHKNNELDINQFLDDNPDFLEIFQSSKKKNETKKNNNKKDKENISNNLSQISKVNISKKNITNPLNKEIQNLTPIKTKSLKDINQSEKKDILQCPICFELLHKSKYSFLVSKCGHICCENCWDKTLLIKLECPLCKKKVKKKNLIKIFI
jgi:regulator of telomere elongation helicase 1